MSRSQILCVVAVLALATRLIDIWNAVPGPSPDAATNQTADEKPTIAENNQPPAQADANQPAASKEALVADVQPTPEAAVVAKQEQALSSSAQPSHQPRKSAQSNRQRPRPVRVVATKPHARMIAMKPVVAPIPSIAPQPVQEPVQIAYEQPAVVQQKTGLRTKMVDFFRRIRSKFHARRTGSELE